MITVTDFRNLEIKIADESLEHALQTHPEMTIEIIESVLKNPLEVRKSTKIHANPEVTSELYYILKSDKPLRYFEVVVKFCKDGNFFSTAMTTSNVKTGELVYSKREEK